MLFFCVCVCVFTCLLELTSLENNDKITNKTKNNNNNQRNNKTKNSQERLKEKKIHMKNFFFSSN